MNKRSDEADVLGVCDVLEEQDKRAVCEVRGEREWGGRKRAEGAAQNKQFLSRKPSFASILSRTSKQLVSGSSEEMDEEDESWDMTSFEEGKACEVM